MEAMEATVKVEGAEDKARMQPDARLEQMDMTVAMAAMQDTGLPGAMAEKAAISQFSSKKKVKIY